MTNAQSKFQVYVPTTREVCEAIYGKSVAACLARVDYPVAKNNLLWRDDRLNNGDLYMYDRDWET